MSRGQTEPAASPGGKERYRYSLSKGAQIHRNLDKIGITWLVCRGLGTTNRDHRQPGAKGRPTASLSLCAPRRRCGRCSRSNPVGPRERPQCRNQGGPRYSFTNTRPRCAFSVRFPIRHKTVNATDFLGLHAPPPGPSRPNLERLGTLAAAIEGATAPATTCDCYS
jgi:hypothetical protein